MGRKKKWPDCINKLSPLKYELRTDIPKFLRKAFNELDVLNDDEIFIPVRPVRILGRCSTVLYLDCPNITAGHHDHGLDFLSDESQDPENYSSSARYYWFDFDVVGLDGSTLELRMVFNTGSADANDGLWGAVWERNTQKIIANIMSTGDCMTTIEATKDQYTNIYESQKILIPTSFDGYNGHDPSPCGDSMKYANNLNLEKIIGLAIRICCVYRSKSVYERCGYDL